ncbi:hypothetical protein Lepto7375DRAFT_5860 [Leptolyngbya sp. PCC 7375]|nr:hypothetical protein Lepto7375DRAFT_5860 [Leptolyngbya sp. PCC 7375]
MERLYHDQPPTTPDDQRSSAPRPYYNKSQFSILHKIWLLKMSNRRLTPNQSKTNRRRLSKRARTVIAAMLLSGGILSPGMIAWANGPAPGTIIRNQATGSFVDPSDSSTQTIISNEVQVEVAEVAGITVVDNGYNEPTDGTVNEGDTVYVDFEITNVGNDPTQFFIPGAATISGGTAHATEDIQVIEYDPDGSGVSAVDLSASNITVPGGGQATGSLAGMPNNGSIPAGGSITVRVPVTAGTAGNDLTVILGNTTAANGQNEVYVAGTNDVYTQDNSGTDNGDTAGAPINNEREAEDSLTVTIAADPNTPTVICPTGSSGTGGGYATSGDGLYLDDIFWLDWNCGVNTQFNPGDVVQKTWTGPHGIEIIATISNITQTLHPYNTGTYFEDRLNTLYGGVNPISLSNLNDGEDPTYDVTFSMTLNGVPIEADIVTAEAESTDSVNEYATWTTDGTPWQPLDVAAGSALNIAFSNGGQTITMDDFPNAGPGTLLALTEDVSTISVDMNAGGKEALGFGIMVPFDFGDANGYPSSGGHFAPRTATGGSQPTTSTPATSLTLATLVNDTPYLGSIGPDTERAEDSDQPTANADGDDNSSLDDEDGITLTTLTEGDTSYTIPAGNITANTTGDATLHAWVDFNQNSSFEASEYQSVVISNGTPAGGLTWSGLSGITPGTTYARFRLTTDTNITASTPYAVAIDGEMEDYAVAIASSTPTPPSVPANACELVLINDGFEDPRITIQPPVPVASFGNVVFQYDETDVPGWLSSADNLIEIWDENNNPGATGIAPVPPFEDNQFAEINAVLNGSLYQDATTTPGTVLTWQFAHRGRTGVDTLNLKLGPPGATVAQINPTTGTTSFSTGTSDWILYQGTYTIPAGQTTTRFEFVAVSTASGSTSEGNFLDAIRFGPLCDHGDADASYPVDRTNNGAAHTLDGVTYLGNAAYAELQANPSAGADGDDNGTGDGDLQDDEDGVTFTSTLEADSTATVDIVASVDAPLSAWIDFNNNGSWDDPGEQIFTDEPLTAGTNSLSFAIPAGATIGNTYARFRISPQSGLAPTGIVGGGEVEDYQVAIQSAPTSGPTFVCDPSFYVVTGNSIPTKSSQLNQVNRSNTPYTFDLVGSPTTTTSGYATNFTYNALAYNPVDNYIYGTIETSDDDASSLGNSNIIRIDANGGITSLGRPAPAGGLSSNQVPLIPAGGYVAGTILSDGTYVLYSFASGHERKVWTITGLDTDTPVSTYHGQLPSSVSFFDFATNAQDTTPNRLYGIEQNSDRLVYFDATNPAAGVTNATPNTTGVNINYGSQFYDAFGNLYFRTNSGSRELYIVDPDTGVASILAPAPDGGQHDGTSCVGVGLTKDINTTDPVPTGDTVTYTYLIANGRTSPVTTTFSDDLRSVTDYTNSTDVESDTPVDGTFQTATLTVVDDDTSTPNGTGTVTFSNSDQTIAIDGLVLPSGSITRVEIEVQVPPDAVAPETYYNQATLTNLPPDLPAIVLSDYPTTAQFEDPTPILVEPAASDPNVLLVKRITAINNDTTTSDGTNLASHNPTPYAYDDNDIPAVSDPNDPAFDENDPAFDPYETNQWPTPLNTYMPGGTDGGNVMPNDEIEYTIYFLSSGDTTAENVLFCDYVPDFTTFIPNAYTGSSPQATGGIGGADLSIELFRNGTTDYHTGANDGDSATYFGPGVDPANSFPDIDCDGDGNGTNANPNGAVVVNLGDLPDANNNITGAYGHVKFRARVK